MQNRLHYFITQSIDWCYNYLDESIFFLLVFFYRKLHSISFFVHYSMIHLSYFSRKYLLNNFSLLHMEQQSISYLEHLLFYFLSDFFSDQLDFSLFSTELMPGPQNIRYFRFSKKWLFKEKTVPVQHFCWRNMNDLVIYFKGNAEYSFLSGESFVLSRYIYFFGVSS